MTQVTVADIKDFDKFYSLLEETLQDGSFIYPRESKNYLLSVGLSGKYNLKKEIISGERQLYVASDNNEIVAYLLTKKPYAGVAFGHWLGVDKNFRHKGIGTRLLQLWEKDVIKTSAHALHLWTTENDFGFYKKNNFMLVGKFEKAWFGIDHFLFYKIIGRPNPKKYR